MPMHWICPESLGMSCSAVSGHTLHRCGQPDLMYPEQCCTQFRVRMSKETEYLYLLALR